MATRNKPREEDKTDIRNLELGEDFVEEKAEAMFYAEIKVILDRVNAQQGLEYDDLHEMTQKVSNHVNTFGLMASDESISTCKQELMDKGLRSFEAAMLANIMPGDAQEAKALILSLDSDPPRFSDDEIQEFVDIVKTYRKED